MKKSVAPVPPPRSSGTKNESHSKLYSFFGIVYMLTDSNTWQPILKDYVKIEIVDNGGAIKDRYRLIVHHSNGQVILLDYCIGQQTRTSRKDTFVKWSDLNRASTHGIRFSKSSTAQEFNERMVAFVNDVYPYAKVNKKKNPEIAKIDEVPIEDVVVKREDERADTLESKQSKDGYRRGISITPIPSANKDAVYDLRRAYSVDMLSPRKKSSLNLTDEISLSRKKRPAPRPPRLDKGRTSKSSEFLHGENKVADEPFNAKSELTVLQNNARTSLKKRPAPKPPGEQRDIAVLKNIQNLPSEPELVAMSKSHLDDTPSANTNHDESSSGRSNQVEPVKRVSMTEPAFIAPPPPSQPPPIESPSKELPPTESLPSSGLDLPLLKESGSGEVKVPSYNGKKIVNDGQQDESLEKYTTTIEDVQIFKINPETKETLRETEEGEKAVPTMNGGDQQPNNSSESMEIKQIDATHDNNDVNSEETRPTTEYDPSQLLTDPIIKKDETNDLTITTPRRNSVALKDEVSKDELRKADVGDAADHTCTESPVDDETSDLTTGFTLELLENQMKSITESIVLIQDKLGTNEGDSLLKPLLLQKTILQKMIDKEYRVQTKNVKDPAYSETGGERKNQSKEEKKAPFSETGVEEVTRNTAHENTPEGNGKQNAALVGKVQKDIGGRPIEITQLHSTASEMSIEAEKDNDALYSNKFTKTVDNQANLQLDALDCRTTVRDVDTTIMSGESTRRSVPQSVSAQREEYGKDEIPSTAKCTDTPHTKPQNTEPRSINTSEENNNSNKLNRTEKRTESPKESEVREKGRNVLTEKEQSPSNSKSQQVIESQTPETTPVNDKGSDLFRKANIPDGQENRTRPIHGLYAKIQQITNAKTKDFSRAELRSSVKLNAKENTVVTPSYQSTQSNNKTVMNDEDRSKTKKDLDNNEPVQGKADVTSGNVDIDRNHEGSSICTSDLPDKAKDAASLTQNINEERKDENNSLKKQDSLVLNQPPTKALHEKLIVNPPLESNIGSKKEESPVWKGNPPNYVRGNSPKASKDQTVESTTKLPPKTLPKPKLKIDGKFVKSSKVKTGDDTKPHEAVQKERYNKPKEILSAVPCNRREEISEWVISRDVLNKQIKPNTKNNHVSAEKKTCKSAVPFTDFRIDKSKEDEIKTPLSFLQQDNQDTWL